MQKLTLTEDERLDLIYEAYHRGLNMGMLIGFVLSGLVALAFIF